MIENSEWLLYLFTSKNRSRSPGNLINLALSNSQNTRYPKALQVQRLLSNDQVKQNFKLH